LRLSNLIELRMIFLTTGRMLVKISKGNFITNVLKQRSLSSNLMIPFLFMVVVVNLKRLKKIYYGKILLLFSIEKKGKL
jgi:membrane protein required for beta-lactamase induction